MTLTGDEKIQTYKYKTTMAADNAVGEGELIPLSKVKKVKGPAYQVPLHKYRKAVSAESIRRVGSDAAINETDEKSWKKSKKLSKVNSLVTLLLIQQNKMLKDSKLHYQWDGLRQRSSLKGTCQLFQWLTRPMLQIFRSSTHSIRTIDSIRFYLANWILESNCFSIRQYPTG